MKYIAAIVMMMCLMSTCIAADEYADLDIVSTLLISSYSSGIYQPDFDISRGSTKLDYVSLSTTEDDVLTDIAAVLVVYSMMVEDSPEIGDLEVIVKTVMGKEVAAYRCDKNWVKGDLNDREQVRELSMKVLDTLTVL